MPPETGSIFCVNHHHSRPRDPRRLPERVDARTEQSFWSCPLLTAGNAQGHACNARLRDRDIIARFGSSGASSEWRVLRASILRAGLRQFGSKTNGMNRMLKVVDKVSFRTNRGRTNTGPPVEAPPNFFVRVLRYQNPATMDGFDHGDRAYLRIYRRPDLCCHC